MDDLEKTMFEMQGNIKLLSEKISNHDHEISEVKSQIKINSEDINGLSINIVKLSGDMQGLSKDMNKFSDTINKSIGILEEQLKKITQEPAEFNEKVKVGVVTGAAVFVITVLGNLFINYLSKR